MTVAALLNQLEGIQERGLGRWSAKCPAHADRNPSLSIREGERGVLLRCWAGCSLAEICAALGVKVADLFHDSDRAERSRQRVPPQSGRVDLRKTAFDFEFHAVALIERAESVLVAASGVDVSQWSDEDMGRVLNAVADAYADRARATLLEQVAFDLRTRAIERERSHYRAA